MASKYVAVESMITSNASANWTLVLEVVTSHNKLKVDGESVVSQVVSTFNQTVHPFQTEVLTLSADDTVLKVDNISLLREDDEETGETSGNSIRVISGQQKLKTDLR